MNWRTRARASGMPSCPASSTAGYAWRRPWCTWTVVTILVLMLILILILILKLTLILALTLILTLILTLTLTLTLILILMMLMIGRALRPAGGAGARDLRALQRRGALGSDVSVARGC